MWGESISMLMRPRKQVDSRQFGMCVLCGDVARTVCGDSQKRCLHCVCYVCAKERGEFQCPLCKVEVKEVQRLSGKEMEERIKQSVWKD